MVSAPYFLFTVEDTKLLYYLDLKGFGTAIGELPPYFMARGARLSGKLGAEEIELSLNNTSSSSSELETDSPKADENLSGYQRLELFLQRLVTRAGFLGIMLCASVSYPLFLIPYL